MSIFGVALIVVLGIVVVLLISIYNKLVQLRMRVDNAWSQIDVQLNGYD